MRTQTWNRGRGFTLIELLVVVAVIALLIGVLLPAVGKARASAYLIVSAQNMKQFYTGFASYAADSDGFFPAYGTSGAGMRNNLVVSKLWGSEQGLYDAMNEDPYMPTCAYDWASPALIGQDIPVNREARMWYIWEELGDPAQKVRVEVYDGSSSPGKQAAIQYIADKGDLFPGCSYLMPEPFGGFGMDKPQNGGLGDTLFTTSISDFLQSPNKSKIIGDRFQFNGSEATIPKGYTPRFDNVGRASGKVILADGFRYMDGGIVDFDASAVVQYYGSWADPGPIFKNSQAWGLPGNGNAADGQQLPLSYRHSGRMGSVHFDGHFGTYTLEESHDPALWYPSGSIWENSGDAIDEAKDFDYLQKATPKIP